MAMRFIVSFNRALVVTCLMAMTVRGETRSGAALLPPPQHSAVESVDSVSQHWQSLADGGGYELPNTDAESSGTTQPLQSGSASAAEPLPLPPEASSIEPSTSTESDRYLELVDPGTWNQPYLWFGPAPWDTGIELGLNGSSGTSESLSIRTGGYVKRESRFSKLDLSTYYNRTTDSGVATQNNAQLDVRNDWLLDEHSPWTLYATTNVFYDEFQAFDLQLNGNTGVGYRFVHEPGLQWIARLGAGTSREIGGPDDRWIPESLVGFEYSQQLSATQTFYSKLDYFPEWDELGEFRLVADMGWEIELVQPSNLSLKISATDRYDSTPNGAEPHLLNYSVLLLLKL